MIGAGSRGSVRVLRTLLDSYQRYYGLDDSPSEHGGAFFANIRAQARIPTSLLQRWVALSIIGGIIVTYAKGLALGVGFAVIGLCIVSLRVVRAASMHRRSIDRDLPALLTSVAASVRAGSDPLSALLAAREYFQKETALVREVERIREGLARGEDEEDLLERFLSIYASQEGELFKRCLILSRRHGSSLADPLHRITKVVRQRQSFRRKIKAALAMHRMSAIGIALCAVAMGALQLGMNPHALDISMHHPVGRPLLLGGIALIVTGLGWMMMMGREASTR